MSACGKNERGEKKYLVTVVKKPAGAEVHAQGIIYDSQLREILRQGDVLGFRNFIGKTGHGLPDEMMRDATKLQTMMHRLVLNNPELEDLHAASRVWLDEHTVLGADQASLNEASQLSVEDKVNRAGGRRTIFLRPVI